MAPQPIAPPPGLFPYGYPWLQNQPYHKHPTPINVGLENPENDGSSQFGNPLNSQQRALNQHSQYD
jgi:hypothetical protein